MVGGALGRTLEEAGGHSFQRRPTAAHPAPGGLLVPAAEAHHERQTRRSRLPACPKAVENLEKKALADDAGFDLIYQDEMEIHRFPALTRMWAPVGQQPEVP